MDTITICKILTVISMIVATISFINVWVKDKRNKKIVDAIKQNVLGESILKFFDIVSEPTVATFILEAQEFLGYSNSMKKLYVRKQIIKFCENNGFPKPPDSIINVAIEIVFNKLKFGGK